MDEGELAREALLLLADDPDPDAQLDLQQVLHEIYDKARYATYLYDASPEPPLSAEDEGWAKRQKEQTL